MSTIEPGWYKDPAEPTTQRYWDGEGWIGDPLPVDATPPEGPPPGAPASGAVAGQATATGTAGDAAAPATPDVGATPDRMGGPENTAGTRQDAADTTQGAAGAPETAAPAPETAAPEPEGTAERPEAAPGTPPAGGAPDQAGAHPTPGAPPAPGTPWPPAWPPPPGTPWTPPPPGTPGAPWPQPGVPVPPGAQPPPGTQVPPGWPPGYPIHPAYAQLFRAAPRPHGYPLADLGRRLAARLVDIGVLIVINAVVNGWFIYRFVQEVWPWYRLAYQRAQAHLPYNDLPQPQHTQSLAFTITLIAAALWFAYEVPSVANRGQTLGKRLLGIKVLRLEADGPVGFGRALRRWNPMGIATLLWTCGIGFVLQFVDCLFVAIDRPLHQALHDKSAATVVVDVKHDRTAPDRTGPDKTGEAR